MFDVCYNEAKNRVLQFDFQKMNMFKSVQCSKKDVQMHSMFDKMMFDPSLKFSIKESMKMVTVY